ncbi:MAG TPA: LUD domain-containing protein [Lacipirellulaceae bacterium]|nr:LUD domain-containing protein [Lacipirellulaceae bacterium]
MTSKEIILGSIRRNRPAPGELPCLNESWTKFVDPRKKFIEVLESVGGKAIVARDQNDLAKQIESLPQIADAQTVASLVSGFGSRNIDVAAMDSPHGLSHVDVAILPGEFGVAENAAVWVTDRQVPLRVLYFLCQHLTLVIPAASIVDHMHAAYDRLIAHDRFGHDTATSRHFGVFIAGPSKTADIEQSLVIGAHGPRSLTVCLVEQC